MKIGIVGGGVVGHATARVFMENHEVRVHDADPRRGTHGMGAVMDCDLVFLCLPTPMRDDGRCDTSIIEGHLNALWYGNETPVVIRSTVPIGFTNRTRRDFHMANLIHSPEFLTARCSVTDAHIPARNIVGGKGTGCHAVDVLTALYASRFPSVPIHHLTNDESEAVKLFQNSFFAVKIAFFNEMKAVCDVKGMCWDDVLNAMLADGRIAHSHTSVPGPDGLHGFGGACLPKDLANLIECAADAGVPAVVCATARRRNADDRNRTASDRVDVDMTGGG